MSVIHDDDMNDIRVWETSGYTPADIVKNAMDTKYDQQRAFAALCSALTQKPDEGIALFQNELERPEVQALLPCARELSARLENYWNARRVALQSKRDQEHVNKGLIDKDNGNGSPRLQSLEVHIDTSKGEFLWGKPSEGYLKEKQIVISIDDGPHPKYTREILNTLKAYGVRANFFSVGNPARAWPELDKAEIEEGHITGSHTMSHPDMVKVAMGGDKAIASEILAGRDTVAKAAGVEIPFFRFPYGSHNDYLLGYTKKNGLTSFQWNMDSSDWKITDPSALINNEVNQLELREQKHEGGIILMHDIHQQTAIALPHLLDELVHRGWTTVVFIPH